MTVRVVNRRRPPAFRSGRACGLPARPGTRPSRRRRARRRAGRNHWTSSPPHPPPGLAAFCSTPYNARALPATRARPRGRRAATVPAVVRACLTRPPDGRANLVRAPCTPGANLLPASRPAPRRARPSPPFGDAAPASASLTPSATRLTQAAPGRRTPRNPAPAALTARTRKCARLIARGPSATADRQGTCRSAEQPSRPHVPAAS